MAGENTAGGGTAGLLRHPQAPKRATLLELLLDVVYVAAIALISMRLASNVSWTGAGQALVLLMAVWWIWSITALLADFYDPERPPIQIAIIWAMLGSVVMTAAIPLSFGDQGWIFAGMYVAIHVGRGPVAVTVLTGAVLLGVAASEAVRVRGLPGRLGRSGRA